MVLYQRIKKRGGVELMKDNRFRYLNHTSVEGLDLIFLVLLLIARILIERYYSSTVFEEDKYKTFLDEYRTLKYGDADD